jgi:hypothetical protein
MTTLLVLSAAVNVLLLGLFLRSWGDNKAKEAGAEETRGVILALHEKS